MKGGGFLDTLTDLSNSISQGASELWEKTKQVTNSITSSSSTPSYTGSIMTPTQTTSSSMGYGGKRTRRRRMKGGFVDNTPLTGLASNSASFSGMTAEAHNLLGGKTKRRGRKSSKNRRRRH
jgi:hypothetical protein